MWSLSFFLCVAVFFFPIDGYTVHTNHGKISGTKEKTGNNHVFYAFKGVPFAQPPVGDLRFAAPVAPLPWIGILNATQQKSECVQSLPTYVRTDKILGSEDCLYLNIYTPKDLDASKITNSVTYPVMVWIHGGGFFEGDNSYQMYNPSLFIDEDIIIVTVSYRLGAFGFLTTEDLISPGNNGLKDQIMALRWVKENIHAFGGDTNNITIWGESAGGVSVSHLLVSPQTKGLFNRAIVESGSALMLLSVGRKQKEIAFKTGELLGIQTNCSGELISRLRDVDYQTLHAISFQAGIAVTFASPLEVYPFTTVLETEHENAALTESPFVMMESGQAHNVTVLMGFNSLEGSGLPDALIRATLAGLQLDPLSLVPPNLGAKPEDLKTVGTLIKENYFKNDTTMYSEDNYLQWFGDMNLIRPIIKQADLLSKSNELYLYEFDYAGYLGNPYRTSFEGTAHAEELNYLFLRLSSPPVLSPADITVRMRLVRMWSNFAKHGKPTVGKDSLLKDVSWNKCKPYPEMHYLHITTNLATGTNPREERTKFWDNIFDTYGSKPLTTY